MTTTQRFFKAFIVTVSALFIWTGCSTEKRQQGTGDGGGGNGFNYKPYEGYIVDPTSLPAYQLYLAPIMTHLAEDSERFWKEVDPDDTSENSGDVSELLSYKTWYLAPTRLKKISKDTLGLSFTDHETQQIAFQDDRAVWIDSEIFEKMEPVDQARLILHEMVMSLYFLKFYSMSEMCQRGWTRTEDKGKSSAECRSLREFDRIFPPEKRRPLNATDYEYIRRVTDFIFTRSTSLTFEDLTTKLYYEGFDKRFFSPEITGVEDDIEMDYADIIQLLEEARLLGRLPTECLFVGLNQKRSCNLSLQLTDLILSPNAKLTGLEFQLSIDPRNTPIFTQIVGAEGSAYVTRDFDPVSHSAVYMVFMSDKMPEPIIRAHGPRCCGGR